MEEEEERVEEDNEEEEKYIKQVKKKHTHTTDKHRRPDNTHRCQEVS